MKEKLQAVLEIAKQNKLKIATGLVIALLIASQVYLYLTIITVSRFATPILFTVGNGTATTTVNTLQAVTRSLEVTETIRNNAQRDAQSNQETGNANQTTETSTVN